MPPTPPIPTLATLDQRPTWHNRAGRVDRSACFVLAANQLWRQIPEQDWKQRITPTPTQASTLKPQAQKRPDRLATLTVYADDLWQLHRREPRAPLRGDFRTAKANAMRSSEETRNWLKLHGHRLKPSPLDPPTRNPNRGAGFSTGQKMLGLTDAWSTTLTVERYPQHKNLKQHFLVCPVCGLNSASTIAASLRDAGPASRSDTAISNPQTPTPKSKPLPTGRVTKLFLPLCTPREWQDAQLAQLWLRTHLRPNRPLTPDAVQLIERYGELFGPRHLRCRQCLGLRYGEAKPLQPKNAPPPTHSAPPLTPIPARRRPRQTRPGGAGILPAGPTPPAPIDAAPLRHPNDLTPAEQDKLLRDLLQRLPSFKALALAQALLKKESAPQ